MYRGWSPGYKVNKPYVDEFNAHLGSGELTGEPYMVAEGRMGFGSRSGGTATNHQLAAAQWHESFLSVEDFASIAHPFSWLWGSCALDWGKRGERTVGSSHDEQALRKKIPLDRQYSRR